MRRLAWPTCALVLSSAVIPAFASAQSLADQKTTAEIEKIQADIDKVRADAAKARADAAKAELDILAAAKGAYTGEGTATSPESGAEAAYMSAILVESAATKINEVVRKWDPTRVRTRILVGSTPPSVAQWVSVQRVTPLLKADLEKAIADWHAVTVERDDQKFKVLGTDFGLTVTALTTALSVFKTNTTVTGVSLTTPNDQLTTALDRKINKSQTSADPSLMLITDTGEVTKLLQPVDELFRTASSTYQTGYPAELAKVDNKPEKLDPAVKLAAANLQAALAAYQTFRTALFAVNASGELPALTAERQAREVALKSPILYIRNFKTAMSVETRKNLFTGIIGAPIFARGAVTVQFTYVKGDGSVSKSGSVVCVSAFKRLTDVPDITTPTPQREKDHPAECTVHED